MKHAIKCILLSSGAVLAATAPTFAATFQVTGEDRCMHNAGPGLAYYGCLVTAEYESSSCDQAYSQLSQLDCCNPSGVKANFYKRDCREVIR